MKYDPVKPDYSVAEDMLANIAVAKQAEATRLGLPPENAVVTDEDRKSVYSWIKGQALSHIVDTEGYGVVVDILNGYMDEFIMDCILTPPGGGKEAVLQSHAFAHAATRIRNRLEADIKYCVESADSVPDVVKHGISIARGMPAND